MLYPAHDLAAVFARDHVDRLTRDVGRRGRPDLDTEARGARALAHRLAAATKTAAGRRAPTNRPLADA